jgi:hypothetical protein
MAIYKAAAAELKYGAARRTSRFGCEALSESGVRDGARRHTMALRVVRWASEPVGFSLLVTIDGLGGPSYGYGLGRPSYRYGLGTPSYGVASGTAILVTNHV